MVVRISRLASTSNDRIDTKGANNAQRANELGTLNLTVINLVMTGGVPAT